MRDTAASPGAAEAQTLAKQFGLAEVRAVFTVHKAASMLLEKVCAATAGHLGIDQHSQNGKGEFKLPLTWNFPQTEVVEGRKGLLGPLRFPVDPQSIAGPMVVHLRDPRDMLVSLFFSEAYSHDVNFMLGNEEGRRAALEAGIDAFVRERALHLYRPYKRYATAFMGRPGVMVLTYEQLIERGYEWAAQFTAGIAPELPPRRRAVLYRKIVEIIEPDQDAPAEDINSHVRKRTPGDHREKLRADTIAFVNEQFADVFDALGYPY